MRFIREILGSDRFIASIPIGHGNVTGQATVHSLSVALCLRERQIVAIRFFRCNVTYGPTAWSVGPFSLALEFT